MEHFLPEDQNSVTILGIIGTMEIAAAEEFSTFLNHRFQTEGNPDWFQDIRHYRKSYGDPFAYQDAKDLRFVLGEATLPDSQIGHQIPNMDSLWINTANMLRKKLNQLHHQQLSPDLNTLYQVATLFHQVTSAPGLEVAGWAGAVKTRAKDILNGVYVRPETPTATPELPEPVKEIEREYEKTQRDREKRPPWGARWTGPKPQRQLSLDRHTRDIYDGNGKSAKSELGELGDQVVEIWLRYFPRGGEVWVDPDGAAMGYIKGKATMIGWFGEAPDEDPTQVRGFVLPYEYEFDGEEIIDIGTKKKLSAVSEDPNAPELKHLNELIQPGTRLNITDYGDLFTPVEEGDPVRISHLHKGLWFPGHLPGSQS